MFQDRDEWGTKVIFVMILIAVFVFVDAHSVDLKREYRNESKLESFMEVHG